MSISSNPKFPQNVAILESSTSLVSKAYEQLKEEIVAGRIEPGKKLKIDELKTQFDYGSSVIREALSLLTSDNLVERVDQRGFFVSAVSLNEYEEILNMRCLLEEQAIRDAVLHGSSLWEEQVVSANYRLSRVSRSLDKNRFLSNPAWEAAHKNFHMILISACRSSLLIKFCKQLYEHNIRYRELAAVNLYHGRDVTTEHTEICEAVVNRDANRSAELLLQHYKKSGSYVRPELPK